MKQPNIFDFFTDWIKTPLTTLGLKLQTLDYAGVEPETVQAALKDHAELTKRVTTLLSMLREDEALWLEVEQRQKDQPPRVLLVDHNDELLKTYSDYLTERGLWVHPATDGDIAVKAARALDFDCAVLGIQMPGVGLPTPPMGGRELCRVLREFTDMPVIFLSSTLYRWQAEVDDIMGDGDAYLEKPCGSETLYDQILYCLGQAREPPARSR